MVHDLRGAVLRTGPWSSRRVALQIVVDSGEGALERVLLRVSRGIGCARARPRKIRVCGGGAAAVADTAAAAGTGARAGGPERSGSAAAAPTSMPTPAVSPSGPSDPNGLLAPTLRRY